MVYMFWSSNVTNVLGVLFDSKLQWTNHVAKSITKANRRLKVYKLLRKFFITKELIKLSINNN